MVLSFFFVFRVAHDLYRLHLNGKKGASERERVRKKYFYYLKKDEGRKKSVYYIHHAFTKFLTSAFPHKIYVCLVKLSNYNVYIFSSICITGIDSTTRTSSCS